MKASRDLQFNNISKHKCWGNRIESTQRKGAGWFFGLVLFLFFPEKFSENAMKTSRSPKSTLFRAQRRKSLVLPCQMFLFCHTPPPNQHCGRMCFSHSRPTPKSNGTFQEHFHRNKSSTEAPKLGAIEPGFQTEFMDQDGPPGISMWN